MSCSVFNRGYDVQAALLTVQCVCSQGHLVRRLFSAEEIFRSLEPYRCVADRYSVCWNHPAGLLEVLRV